jgi:hypothetical protein
MLRCLMMAPKPAWIVLLLTPFVATSACHNDNPQACGAPTCGPHTDLGCGPNMACVGAAGVYEYEATCVPKCKLDADCASGEHCVFLFSDPVGSVCVSEASPPRCTGLPPDLGLVDCPRVAAYCFTDGKTLVQPFSLAKNRTCGYEISTCAGVCAADGGASCR